MIIFIKNNNILFKDINEIIQILIKLKKNVVDIHKY